MLHDTTFIMLMHAERTERLRRLAAPRKAKAASETRGVFSRRSPQSLSAPRTA